MHRGRTLQEGRQKLELFQATELLLEECRMVLPGIQGLFGFQLIAVFSEQFHQQLGRAEQGLHLLAIALIGVAIALIMTPAAAHRQSNPRQVSAAFIRLSTRLLLCSMAPLSVGVCIDFYLVARVITGTQAAAWFTAALAAVFVTLWWVVPRMFRRHEARART
jgi:hypothetical protein